MFGLGTTLLVRAERVVRSRHALHRCFLREQRGGVSDEALLAFDSYLVNASSAFDALAQFVHVVYAVPGRPREVGWRRNDWLNAKTQQAPAVGAAMARGVDDRGDP